VWAVSIFDKLRRHLICKPLRENIPNLKPEGKIQKAIISALQLERNIRSNYIISFPRKVMRLYDAEEMLSWFGLKDGRDLLLYPSITFEYPTSCDMYSNTVLAYLIPRFNVPSSPVKILVPDADYVLSVEELINAIKDNIRGKQAKIYVLSKYARPGNLYTFIRKLSAKKVELYIASEAGRWKYRDEKNDNVWVVGTSSHRKLLLIITYDEEEKEPVFIGYRGSMNIFFPGVDDYLEAVNDWSDMKRLLHGIFRAFFIF
jgi:hypothetical protein